MSQPDKNIMETVMFLFKRPFLNLVLVIPGILTLVTGLFLLLHIKSYLIMYVHEFGSLIREKAS